METLQTTHLFDVFGTSDLTQIDFVWLWGPQGSREGPQGSREGPQGGARGAQSTISTPLWEISTPHWTQGRYDQRHRGDPCRASRRLTGYTLTHGAVI